MVHVPTRGDVPVRLGPSVSLLPDYGPSTMDADVYRDPVRFELKRERVLATHWLLAGRSQQIAEPGDWLTYEGHGEIVVVTRQPDGSLAAFHNVCQHRGPAIVGEAVGCGARRFTCPYHGWVYDTTGLVVGVPDREDFDPDHLDGLHAPAVAADEWGGWVWINLAGPDAAADLRESIGPEITADLGRFRMEDMVLHEVVEWDVPVSYKAIVDGFNEIYHTKQLHGVPAEWVRAAAQHLVPHRRRQLHVLRPPRREARRTRHRPRSPSLRDLPLRRVSEHGVQLQSGTRPGVPTDPDRRRPDPLPVLGADLSRRSRRSGSTRRTTSGR